MVDNAIVIDGFKPVIEIIRLSSSTQKGCAC